MSQDADHDEDKGGMPPLAKEDELGAHSPADPSSEDPITRSMMFGKLSAEDDTDMERPNDDMPQRLKDLHPYAQILSINDLESCLKLEETVFPPHQACSREKLMYRLNTCGELSLGLFTSAETSNLPNAAPTVHTANSPDSANPSRKGVLLAYMTATKTANDLVSDQDMMRPPPDQSNVSNASFEQQKLHYGHNEAGRTIALHSVAVLPAYQKTGLGTTLMKSYVQRMVEGDVADRISLLALENLVPYYEKLGFEHRGKSEVEYGGGDWVNMVLEFEHVRPQSDE